MINKPKIVLLASLLATVLIGLFIAGCSSDNSPTATIGKRAPDFTLENLEGESVSLSDFFGKPILINFWNTGCPPCREELPYLQEIYDETQDTNLVMLLVDLGENAPTIEEFLKDNHLSLPILVDTYSKTAPQYGIQGIPTTFFIDKEGIIQSKVIGRFPNKEAIESRLNIIMP